MAIMQRRFLRVAANRGAVLVAASFLLCGLAGPLAADTIIFTANRDTNLLRADGIGESGRQFNDINLGGLQRFPLGNSGSADARELLGFDLAPFSGQYLSVDSITLQLTFLRFGRPATNPDLFSQSFDIEVYPITAANADWVEGTGTNGGTAADNSGATWRHKNRDAANPLTASADWAGGDGTAANGGLTAAGVDYVNTLLASYTTGTTSPADETVIDFSFTGNSTQLTDLMDSLVAANAGFLLFAPGADSLESNRDRMFFHSRESSTSDFYPQLVVEYTPIPEPSSLTIIIAALACLLACCRRRPIS